MKRKPLPSNGYSLIEMLVVISLLSAVFVMVSQLLYGLLQAEQASTRDAVFDRRLADLALQWRSDLYAAANVAVDDSGSRMECNVSGGSSVAYSVADDAVVRSTGGQPARREAYRLPGARIAFRRSVDDPQTIELVIERALPQLTQTPAWGVRGGELVLRATPHPPATAPERKE